MTLFFWVLRKGSIMEKTKGELLREKLFYKNENGFEKFDQAKMKAVFDFCEDYKTYLDNSKTEREAADCAVEMAKAAGYVPYEFGKKYSAGDKVYYLNRGKSLVLAYIGTENIESGTAISAAHIDCPRIDLKPNPLYEEGNIAYFKTHYYGGIKKYQWVTIPLALHGVIVRADGEKIEVKIGEKDDEPLFYITDLLPHLGAAQSQKKLGEAFTGEDLNVLAGTQPFDDSKVSEKVKLNILNILNEKYGITEADFATSELTFTPAFKARDIGFDRSLIGSYGHDDRVCAYPSLKALFDIEAPKKTAIVILADKEEIGSEGNTGLNSNFFYDFIVDLSLSMGANPRVVLQNSKCLSADVNAAFDPHFADVYEKRNTSFVNHGVVMTKYTGARGKSGTSDASAEFVHQVKTAFDKGNVLWQMGELGKVDMGGGGTVAMYLASLNIDVVDIGVPVLSMHAPWEAVSKIDVFSTYEGVKSFFENI